MNGHHRLNIMNELNQHLHVGYMIQGFYIMHVGLSLQHNYTQSSNNSLGRSII